MNYDGLAEAVLPEVKVLVALSFITEPADSRIYPHAFLWQSRRSCTHFWMQMNRASSSELAIISAARMSKDCSVPQGFRLQSPSEEWGGWCPSKWSFLPPKNKMFLFPNFCGFS